MSENHGIANIMCTLYSDQVKRTVEDLEIIPEIDKKPMSQGELVGDALSVISLKDMSDDLDPDRMGKRNSYRNLHRPEISSLTWVSQSANKEEV